MSAKTSRPFVRSDDNIRRPDDDERLKRHLELISRWMDSAFIVPGTGWRFGLDPLLGLLPGFGDSATTIVSLYVLFMASRLGVPRITLARMALNVAIDSILGSVPLVGDFFDAWWKSNVRNMELLRRHATTAPGGARKASLGDWLFVVLVILLLAALFVGCIVFAWYLASLLFAPLFRSASNVA